MIYILDTADIDAIKHCNEYYPLAGVTTNPSIIAKEHTKANTQIFIISMLEKTVKDVF